MILRRLLFSAFSSTLAAGLFWTGFPIWIEKSVEVGSLAGIYALAVGGSLAFSLFGGLIADRFDRRLISVGSQLVSVATVLSVTALVHYGHGRLAIWCLPVIYFNLALSNVAEASWLLGIGEGQMFNRVANRALWLTLAKLIGFGFGPVAFSFAGAGTSVACSTLFLIAGLVQISLLRNTSPQVPEMNSFRLRNAASHLRRFKWFIVAGALTGASTIPLNATLADKLGRLASISHVSTYWILGGVLSLCGITLCRKFKALSNVKAMWLVSIAMASLGAFSLLSSVPGAIVAAGAGYLLLAPLFSLRLQVLAAESAAPGELGLALGLWHCVFDLGSFVGLWAAQYAFADPIVTAGLAALVIILRQLAIQRAIRASVHP